MIAEVVNGFVEPIRVGETLVRAPPPSPVIISGVSS